MFGAFRANCIIQLHTNHATASSLEVRLIQTRIALRRAHSTRYKQAARRRRDVRNAHWPTSDHRYYQAAIATARQEN